MTRHSLPSAAALLVLLASGAPACAQAAPRAQSCAALTTARTYHCSGGPGADGFESITALDRWVESGQTPDHLIATRGDGKLSRPLCHYPTLPRYKGNGDPADAGSFECR